MTRRTHPRSMVVARHYLPGGRENGGGIGRLVGYIADAALPGEVHLVTDTRGKRWSPPLSLIFFALALLNMVRDRVTVPARIHHIHIAGRGSTLRKLILTEVARAVGCVHVLHQHDYDYAADFMRRPVWQKRLICRMFRGASRVVVLGRRDMRTATGMLKVPADRVVVLRNGAPDPGPGRSRTEAVPNILFLGTLGPRKGVPELLAALASPALSQSKWRATLAGDGPVENYRRQVAALGLADRVDLPGWLNQSDTHALLSRADILVLPSHGEGMAMATLEGLAYGIPVVTTRVGAHEEVIEDGRNGVFVPIGDPAALAAEIRDLIHDPERRSRLGDAARKRYLERFSMTAYLEGLAALYASLAPPPARATETLRT